MLPTTCPKSENRTRKTERGPKPEDRSGSAPSCAGTKPARADTLYSGSPFRNSLFGFLSGSCRAVIGCRRVGFRCSGFACGLLLLTLLGAPRSASAQALLSGRLTGARWPGSTEQFAYSAIFGFDTLAGHGHESKGFRTFETEPPGWFRFSAEAGHHTLLFTGPNHFMRPMVVNNVFLAPGDKIERLRFAPRLDFTNFFEGAWDPKPATDYFQRFIATGRNLTSVGFRLANDGVDGFGPKSQNLVVSVHRRGPGTPETWPQVGPPVLVPDVDCGGPKNYIWCAGWNSGEVPLVPGETYAVHLRAEKAGNSFQAFWRPDPGEPTDCYRLGATNCGYQGHQIWLAVGADSDGLVVPYNKRVHKQFGSFAGFAPKWSQSYVAAGRSLAGVVLYAAVGGAQPPLSRQRLAVRVRQGGPEGAVCGLEKVATGNGNYTGDASWGVFGAAFAPGEVPLTPGATYALEFESLENAETLHGFVNIKGAASDDRPGFNPYRKAATDDYPSGAAYKQGQERMPFSLDMQVIEYESAATNWALATEGPNLLANGDMERFEPAPEGGPRLPAPARGQSGYQQVRSSVAIAPASWKPFGLDPRTKHALMADENAPTNHFACIFANGGETADGGFVQRIEGLTSLETYRLTGRVRASWPLDFEHQTSVGVDATGQDNDPNAPTIVWSQWPPRHGVFVDVLAAPVRPATNAISVWLRGRSTWKGDAFAPYKADFDDFALRPVRTSPPGNRR
jgi:hypothetical protein